MSIFRKIQTKHSALMVGALYHLYQDAELDLNPPYQRGAVWNLEKKRNLWKSLLMGLPVGSIFFNLRFRHDTQYRVVDGQQRMRAILEYVEDKFSLPSSWFPPEFLTPEDLRDPEEVYYSGLSPIGQRVMRNGLNPINVYEISLDTVEKEAELYLLINFGGVPQNEGDKARAQAVVKSSSGELGPEMLQRLEEARESKLCQVEAAREKRLLKGYHEPQGKKS